MGDTAGAICHIFSYFSDLLLGTNVWEPMSETRVKYFNTTKIDGHCLIFLRYKHIS